MSALLLSLRNLNSQNRTIGRGSVVPCLSVRDDVIGDAVCRGVFTSGLTHEQLTMNHERRGRIRIVKPE
jgi:hypothetical protein